MFISEILERKCLHVTCINFEMSPCESKMKEKTQLNHLSPGFRTKHSIYYENALSDSFWILQCLMTHLLPSCSSRAHALPTEVDDLIRQTECLTGICTHQQTNAHTEKHFLALVCICVCSVGETWKNCLEGGTDFKEVSFLNV